MSRKIITTVLLTAALLATPALAATHKAHKPNPSTTVTYNRHSPDPNVGWHWEGGMRVCHQDCDNPEIPGSRYTCKNVTWRGMAARECDWSSH
ncbi:MAG TPA: hypothetical protein VGG01_17735 [Xanthobacteraceae bacterium]|jgi:hypothetical protein